MTSHQRNPHILVLSANNMENFGDRLGYYNMNSVLPPNATVTYANFTPWNVPNPNDIDVLVVGIGNSVFELLLGENVLRLIEAAPRVVGVFGTQYRQTVNKTRLRRLISNVDCWFARNKEDIEWFGSYSNNVHHLGDWLIDLFPMATPALNEELNIIEKLSRMQAKSDPLEHAPLDRIIQMVQKYQRVYSPKLHLLLCALTSASYVAYKEQREFGFNEPSGKFNSLLHDVFSRHFPEDKYFEVDRQMVIDYKGRVRSNMELLRAKIEVYANGTTMY